MRQTLRTLFAAAALAALGCSANGGPNGSIASQAPTSVATRMATTSAWNPVLNGKMLYLEGRDLGGHAMIAQNPPLFHRCVDCHMANGAGGRHFTDGAISADLRHAALVTAQQHPYTIVLLERAISTGVDNEGKSLDPVMPRWHLSQRDLHDVAQYVFTQLK